MRRRLALEREPWTGSAAAAHSAAPESRRPALIDELGSFWRSRPGLPDLRIHPLAVDAPGTLLRQLGPAPVQVGGHNLVELLTPAYRMLAEQAERRALE